MELNRQLLTRLLQDAEEKERIHKNLHESYKSFAEFLREQIRRMDNEKNKLNGINEKS